MINPIITLRSLRLAVQASHPGMHRGKSMDRMLELQRYGKNLRHLPEA